MANKFVMFYESAGDLRSRVAEFFPAHRARWQAYADRGELLMIGPFSNPQDEGSMGVFSTRAAAEAFAAGDPFVLNGLVKRWYVYEWLEALVP